MYWIRRIALLFLLLTPSLVFATDVGRYFDAGMKAFRAGDYREAVNAFEKARKAGLDIPALFYNLGVGYYKLEDWAKAQEMFLRTSRFRDMAPLAYYNLGLISLKKGNRNEAKKWFSQTMTATDDPRLEGLAQQQLDELKQVKEAWATFVSAGLGYDSNVTLDNDTLTNISSQSDYFTELFAHTRGVLTGTSNDGVILKASLFGDVYKELTDFNLIEANIGAYKTFPVSTWRNEAGGYVTYSTLGGSGYLQSANLSWLTRNNISDRTRLRMRLRLRYVEAVDNQYSAVDGSAEDLRIEGRWLLNSKNRFRAYYQLELNQRNGSETTTTFTSLSPTRNTLRGEYTLLINQDWSMRLAGAYRNSSYSEANTEADGTVIHRNDDRLRAYLEFSRILNRHTLLGLEYMYTDNRSNIDRYTYDQQVIMANLQFMF